jgi:hypothetical protein
MSASNLYTKVYGMTKDEALEKTSYLTFENNPFKNLKKVWHGN